MSKKPLKATDKRRIAGKSKRGVKAPEQGGSGAGAPLASLFNDRRRPNGNGKKAF